MNKEEIKYLIPIMQAFVDGETIQYYNGMKWIDLTGNQCNFQFPAMFRIKPEPKYRPFKDVEECWTEMQKHQPVGWLKVIRENARTVLNYIHNKGCIFSNGSMSFEQMFEKYTFADGTKFGIKEE